MKLLAALFCACALGGATASYTCTGNYNFIAGFPYSQISLTDACSPSGTCDANPIYAATNSIPAAVEYCKTRCDDKAGCTGFFFQKHTNGHEICGFYAAAMDRPAAQWMRHHHAAGSQVCQKAAAPAPAPPRVEYHQIPCGHRCHLIQWPYSMHASFPATTAHKQCEAACDASDCKAFSLQYDYDLQNGNQFCFLYHDSQEPSPEKCASDPFNAPGCSYPTRDGQFWVSTAAQSRYNVLAEGAQLPQERPASALGGNLIVETAASHSLYPSTAATEVAGREALPFSTSLDLGGSHDLEELVVVSDWWQKRPTTIMVCPTGPFSALLNRWKSTSPCVTQQLVDYDAEVCGQDGQRHCEYPSAPSSQLRVSLGGMRASEIQVTLAGLLSPSNNYVSLQGMRVYGSAVPLSATPTPTPTTAAAVDPPPPQEFDARGAGSGQASPYDCLTRELWSQKKSEWCCEHEGYCPHEGSQDAAKQGFMHLSGTAYLSSALQGGLSPTLELAFQSLVAMSVGTVCGPAGTKTCNAGDVTISTQSSLAVSFHLRVANGTLAASAAANLQHSFADGSRWMARLALAGAADLSGLNLGEIKIERPEIPRAPEDLYTDNQQDSDSLTDSDSPTSRQLARLALPILLFCGALACLLIVCRTRRLADIDDRRRLAAIDSAITEITVQTEKANAWVAPPAYEPLEEKTCKEQV